MGRVVTIALLVFIAFTLFVTGGIIGSSGSGSRLFPRYPGEPVPPMSRAADESNSSDGRTVISADTDMRTALEGLPE
jgi:hypothetical protein